MEGVQIAANDASSEPRRPVLEGVPIVASLHGWLCRLFPCCMVGGNQICAWSAVACGGLIWFILEHCARASTRGCDVRPVMVQCIVRGGEVHGA
jgi:hypothetical protein